MAGAMARTTWFALSATSSREKAPSALSCTMLAGALKSALLPTPSEKPHKAPLAPPPASAPPRDSVDKLTIATLQLLWSSR